MQNLKMLLGLRHPTVVRRHDEQGEVDCSQPGDHVADEILMARNIDNSKGDARQGEMRKTKIYCDSPRFFLGQAIGIDSRERF